MISGAEHRDCQMSSESGSDLTVIRRLADLEWASWHRLDCAFVKGHDCNCKGSAELDEMERWILASGQIPCGRPHHTLYWPGSRCYCGAQV